MGKNSIVRRGEREMNRRMTDLFDRAGWAPWLDWPGLDLLREGDKMLRIEEFRDGETLVIRSEMPGIDPDKDVEIDVRDHMLEIHAERREEQSSEDQGRRRSEFRYGSFFRAVLLPAEAKEQDMKATYKDGVLEVRVPCGPTFEEKPHRIPVTHT